jgi:hypothetical protein
VPLVRPMVAAFGLVRLLEKWGGTHGHSQHAAECWEPDFDGSYLAATTDFTEILSPFAVPVTLASSQASVLSLSSAAWFEVSRV